ncbi:MAG: hypothetical protein DRO90_01660 [Candidatus Altiarchaeales archaeon]|nr:MAG: hypothetical protein DRO95_01055 [Candidatus Altiarchaeales archaeon]RLI94666.1 MAG: hypothetical protein DRO90_01660 [Candidatus Altiarchaeales archaeon]HDO82209.1 hypothetical protein [Candidatus Altiarchaeales archaeon]HEX54858.1 hypothetical protein [Candidatus Altiarchaeales archaeon]
MARIALMSSWNAACGVSVHAELIGREFIRQGHELKVFAPLTYEDDHTYLWFNLDEEFVTRNFSFLRYGNRYKDEKLLSFLYLDPSFAEEDFDFFIVEKPTSIPLNKLLPLFNKIKKRARTIAIMHEGLVPENPYFFKFDWDSIVVFDERYKEVFSEIFPRENIHIVPFPCYMPEKKDKKEARRALNLGINGSVIFTYGRFYFLRDVLALLNDIHEEYNIRYICMVRNIKRYIELSELMKRFRFLDVRLSRFPIFSDEFHNFVFSADCVLFYRKPALHNPVSSSAHICLGFLRPLLCPDNEFFYTFKNEVIKYRRIEEIKKIIIDIIENEEYIRKTIKAASDYTMRNSADRIAKKILNL